MPLINLIAGKPFLFSLIFSALFYSAFKIFLRKDSLPAQSLLKAMGILFLILYMGLVAVYTRSYTFLDHVEGSVAAAAGLFYHKQILFEPFYSENFTGMFYGPVLYLTHVFFLHLWGPSILSLKAAAAFAGAAEFFFLYLILRPFLKGSLLAAALGIVSISLLFFSPASFWIRGESFQGMLTAFALWSVLRRSRNTAVLFHGIALGLCVGIKIYGFLFFLPTLVMLFNKYGVRAVFATLAAAGILFFSLFALPGVSLANHFLWLRLAMDQGVASWIFKISLKSVIIFSAPAFALCALATLNRPGFWKENGAWIFSLLLSILFLLRFTAKPGAGPYYNLPLMPLLAYLGALAYRAVNSEEIKIKIKGFAETTAIFFGTVTVMAVRTVFALYFFAAQLTIFDGDAMIQDLDRALQRRPGETVAIGWNSPFQHHWYEAHLVLKGQPYFLNPVTLMDIGERNLTPPDILKERWKRGEIQNWLFSKGKEPFRMENPFFAGQNRELLPEDFKKIFFERYEKSDATGFFDVWSLREKS